MPYVGLLLLVSYLGTYGGGIGAIPRPWGTIAAAVIALGALGAYFAGIRSGLWYTSSDEWRDDVLPGLQRPGEPELPDQTTEPAFS
ncbi:MAG: hypothetical protein ACYDH5_02205 [Acidimicrobiales bacterium]